MTRPTTQLMPVPLVPEISLYLVAEPVGLFDLAGGEFRSDEPPPFWAFVWAGGQALARYLLDHPAEVAGLRVHDEATGSGIVAIAAALAGAADVTATDVDPAAVQAAHRNAVANGVNLGTGDDAGRGARPGTSDDAGRGVNLAASHDAAGGAGVDVLLAGDVFYSPAVAPLITSRLRAARKQGVSVLVGDPGRGYFPEHLFEQVAEYVVPVPAALEDAETLATGVWRMR
ncbi:methyltransferase [Actinoplanes sp. TBRC 11911]|uniref:class I SAM-dependent methyltransferase n=1 Tax=Actinoplanes sp. TBRC 11911 TaxID=2729386 RepID=UPI00145FA6FC|nr:50S ribosomal protein L11 methyltransferase [Actinoplanes sp. TBRC 11911]NMO55576.1 methyltransferase [Actinoplanes sp. TBRC 11911]